MNFEQGLAMLKQYATNTNWYTDSLVYEARLTENLVQERRYGPDEQSRSSRARIVDQLNQLLFSYLGSSFTDPCLVLQPHLEMRPLQRLIFTEELLLTIEPEQLSQHDCPRLSAAVVLGIAPGSQVAAKLVYTNENEPQRTSPPTFLSSTHPGIPRTNAFISYSHKDNKSLDELQTHLAHYIRKETINVWDDTKIQPGAKWREEIEQALQSTKVAVLLVSANFLASSFIVTNELPPLLAAAEKEGTIILSVLLRPCAFSDSDLAQYQSVNSPSNPLSEMTRGKRDAMWAKIAELVRDALKA
jgi:hypothetical protein